MKKRFIEAIAVFFAAMFVLQSTAFAMEVDPGQTASSIRLSALIVTVIVSYLIPIATAFITKASASVGLKQFVTALLAAINAVVTGATLNDGTAVLSKEVILFAVLSFVSAQVSYGQFWKPRQINTKKALLPAKGLG